MPARGRSPRSRGPGAGPVGAASTLPVGPVPTTTGVAEVVRDRDDPRLVTLMLDGVPSSALHLDDPERLDFEYMQQIGAALALLPDGPVDALHLGAAGCTLPRHLDAVRPGSRQVAVDVDAVLLDLVRGWFALPRAPRLRLRPGDGRAVLAAAAPSSLDVVVRDAFDGGRTPVHLTTVEFAAEVGRVLRPGGMFLANIADRPPLAGARAEVAAVLGQDLASGGVALLAEPGVLRGRRYGNLVLVCVRGSTEPGTTLPTDRAVDLHELSRVGRRLPVPVRALVGEELTEFVGTARPARDAA